MPLYEYECEACGQRFELIRKFSDPPVQICAVCGKSPVRRLASSPAIQFKGSGWYITDYAQKGKGDKAGGADKAAGEKTAEGKTEGKSEGKEAATTTADGASAKTDASSKPAASETSHKAQGTRHKPQD